MLSKIFFAWLLVAICVAIHALGITLALRWLRTRHSRMEGAFLPAMLMMVRVAGGVVILHIIEISLWAAFYTWKGCLPDFDTAFYFSAVTYTTTGYGDIVLPKDWRSFSSVEALTGILMCGWSTGFFFAVVSRRNPLHHPPHGHE